MVIMLMTEVQNDDEDDDGEDDDDDGYDGEFGLTRRKILILSAMMLMIIR